MCFKHPLDCIDQLTSKLQDQFYKLYATILYGKAQHKEFGVSLKCKGILITFQLREKGNQRLVAFKSCFIAHRLTGHFGSEAVHPSGSVLHYFLQLVMKVWEV